MGYIFVHGLGQTPSNWTETISYLEGHIQVNCPDLFALCKVQKISYQNLYNAFKEYCDEFSELLNLCGISLGAILAINYAINHPEKVKSLVLIAPQYKMPRILLKFQSMLFFFIPEPSFRKLGIKKKDILQLTNSMLNLNFSDKLNNVSCPTLIICGTKDYANKKAAKNLANNILEATSHFIDNSGHEVNVEAPKTLATLLNTFYSRGKCR
ncbi:alpha/beta fold hydrolase [Sporosarcina limicola]|uniref:Pimeloyl-ACP methyl ester carboxylesterase n=1 Tax=Sporosarcina limicola TaxID=34101 RepID=A0A927REZ9_9BACL|nr:pimeloyl-ACP methyl ester carboxylesterase [Sporosarcina limicola]